MKKENTFRALALSVLPSVIFLFSGIMNVRAFLTKWINACSAVLNKIRYPDDFALLVQFIGCQASAGIICGV